ncbi:hypothetical protein VP01_662g4 [Puccinia sorghi]|uniref:Uncharacterized protein n=1 Tax=Puccinia sorghi TaxID=27349 RepID=A0A0L6UH84_9BASI|nr:hypothetical protein VP01_662g4 [Puccinia sorghi]
MIVLMTFVVGLQRQRLEMLELFLCYKLVTERQSAHMASLFGGKRLEIEFSVINTSIRSRICNQRINIQSFWEEVILTAYLQVEIWVRGRWTRLNFKKYCYNIRKRILNWIVSRSLEGDTRKIYSISRPKVKLMCIHYLSRHKGAPLHLTRQCVNFAFVFGLEIPLGVIQIILCHNGISFHCWESLFLSFTGFLSLFVTSLLGKYHRVLIIYSRFKVHSANHFNFFFGSLKVILAQRVKLVKITQKLHSLNDILGFLNQKTILGRYLKIIINCEVMVHSPQHLYFLFVVALRFTKKFGYSEIFLNMNSIEGCKKVVMATIRVRVTRIFSVIGIIYLRNYYKGAERVCKGMHYMPDHLNDHLHYPMTYPVYVTCRDKESSMKNMYQVTHHVNLLSLSLMSSFKILNHEFDEVREILRDEDWTKELKVVTNIWMRHFANKASLINDGLEDEYQKIDGKTENVRGGEINARILTISSFDLTYDPVELNRLCKRVYGLFNKISFLFFTFSNTTLVMSWATGILPLGLMLNNNFRDVFDGRLRNKVKLKLRVSHVSPCTTDKEILLLQGLIRGMEGTLGVLYTFVMSFQKGIGCIQKYGIRSINHFNMGNLGWFLREVGKRSGGFQGCGTELIGWIFSSEFLTTEWNCFKELREAVPNTLKKFIKLSWILEISLVPLAWISNMKNIGFNLMKDSSFLLSEKSMKAINLISNKIFYSFLLSIPLRKKTLLIATVDHYAKLHFLPTTSQRAASVTHPNIAQPFFSFSWCSVSCKVFQVTLSWSVVFFQTNRFLLRNSVAIKSLTVSYNRQPSIADQGIEPMTKRLSQSNTSATLGFVVVAPTIIFILLFIFNFFFIPHTSFFLFKPSQLPSPFHSLRSRPPCDHPLPLPSSRCPATLSPYRATLPHLSHPLLLPSSRFPSPSLPYHINPTELLR